MLTQEKPKAALTRPARVERYLAEDVPSWLSEPLQLHLINLAGKNTATRINLQTQPGVLVAVSCNTHSGEYFSRLVLGLEQPAHGEIWLNQRGLTTLGHDELAHWRQQKTGWFTAKALTWPLLSLYDNLLLATNGGGTTPQIASLLEQAQLSTVAAVAFGRLSPEQRFLGRLLSVLAKAPQLVIYEAFQAECSLNQEVRQLASRLLTTYLTSGGTVIWLGEAAEYQNWQAAGLLSKEPAVLAL